MLSEKKESTEVDVDNKENSEEIYFLIECGKVKMIKLLLDRGFNVNTKNEQGVNLLHHAIQNNQPGVFEYLFSREDIEVDTQDPNIAVALHLSAEYDDVELLKNLLNRGFDVNAKNNQGKTPLHLAIEEGHTDTVRYLISRTDIQVNAADNEGLTPLHWAVKRPQAISYNEGEADHCLSKGWQSSEANYMQNEIAKDKQSLFAVIQLLLEHPQIDVNTLDNIGDTPLHLVAREGRKTGKNEILKFLCCSKKSFKINQKNKDGKTAIELAAGESCVGIVNSN